MSTNSTIAIELVDGSVMSVYCHFDGYTEYVGKVLNEHFSSPEKAEELVKMGAISSLGPEIGQAHKFHTPDGRQTTFYSRDRGEALEVHKFANFAQYLAQNTPREYNYIMRAGVWMVFERFAAERPELFEPLSKYCAA